MKEKLVCIIGAGVAGIATAKVFLSQGHRVMVYEKVGSLGGVWSPERRYPGVRLQTKRDHYAFSDFPMPAHYPEFPSGQQVYEYLCAYAEHFGVDQAIKYRKEVRSLMPRLDGAAGWQVRVRDLDSSAEDAQDFDFVIVCNGVFCEPQVPPFPGRDQFEAGGGVVIHSSRVADETIWKDHDVAVVGFGKSALDLAEASLATARSTTMIARRVPWKVPHRIGRANIKHFILSRFTELWFPHPDMRGMRRVLHTWLSPVVDLYWWMAEFVIGRKVGLRSPELRPEIPLRHSAPCITLAVDNLKSIRNGSIALHRAPVASFTANGLALEGGKQIGAQVVVLATGFKQDLPFLAEREKALLFDTSGAMLLYRFLVNPDIPNLAFNGYNGVGVCQLSAEVGAAWLHEFMTRRIPVPSRDVMHQSIRAEIDLRRSLLPAANNYGHFVTPATMGYLDQLLGDLGLPPADHHKGLFDWMFTPLDPADYRDLLQRSRVA